MSLSSPLEVIAAKRAHVARLANEGGAEGEQKALSIMKGWLPRPKGQELRNLFGELARSGINIRPSSFDALALPAPINLLDPDQIRAALPYTTFMEIKTANQARVKPGFRGFFFALTESEISAAEQLGERHKVALYNKITGELQITSVQDILARTTSMNWQLSVQL